MEDGEIAAGTGGWRVRVEVEVGGDLGLVQRSEPVVRRN